MDGGDSEYTHQYQRIVSSEQRSRYKEDFNSQYNEYRDLHKAIDKVSKRFAQLEDELRRQHEGTSAWQVKTSQTSRDTNDTNDTNELAIIVIIRFYYYYYYS